MNDPRPSPFFTPLLYPNIVLNALLSACLATYWPAIHQLSDWLCGSRLISKLVVMWKLHRVFWSHMLCACIDNFMILNWATTSFIANHTRRWWTIWRLLFPSCARRWGKGCINETDYHYSIISPLMLVAKSNRLKGGVWCRVVRYHTQWIHCSFWASYLGYQLPECIQQCEIKLVWENTI